MRLIKREEGGKGWRREREGKEINIYLLCVFVFVLYYL